ncbi:Similar to lola: Longitudinals lacking protein [Cotesia congregata]|uniref:Isoforms A/B/D/L (Drosophila melanogaster) n=1 Tax=Cotesia congregata TaxID=51543 RepID=A0A8J2MVH2_COTCN|nr:Similar to lola: Longitudinals lacking protein [Cotesia congregata]
MLKDISKQRVHKRRSRPLNDLSYELTNFKCPQCGKLYKAKTTLLTHMKLECGGQKIISCSICPTKFSQTIELRRHIKHLHSIYLPPKFLVFQRNPEDFVVLLAESATD